MRPQERLREPRRLLLWSICSPRSTPGLHDRRLQVPWVQKPVPDKKHLFVSLYKLHMTFKCPTRHVNSPPIIT